MNSKRNKPKNKRRRRRPTASAVGSMSFNSQLPRMGVVCPPSMRTLIRYIDPNFNRLGVPSGFNVFTMRANDVWDPDPLLLSGGLTGVAEWSAFYASWRVHRVHVEWQIANHSTTTRWFYMFASSTNTVPLNLSGAIDLAETPWATKPVMLAPAGSFPNQTTIRRTYNLNAVYGNAAQFLSNEALSGRGTRTPQSPGQFIFLQFVTYSNGTEAQTAVSNLRITYDVEFYGQYPLVG